MKDNRTVRILSLVAFSIGLLLATILIGITVWGDLEAILFDPGIQQEAKLGSLRCPVMMTSREAATVRARVKNSLDRPTDVFVRARITQGFVTLIREETTQFSLAPGESRRVEWAVGSEDAAYKRLVLVKMTVQSGYPLPNRQGTCGILVLNTPILTGNQLYFLGVTISLICAIGGGITWFRSHPHRLGLKVQIARLMVFLSFVVIIGLVVSLLGLWVVGLVALIVILLTVGVFIGYLTQ